MHFTSIVLATILGLVSCVPVNSPGFKDRIFTNAVTPNDKIEQLKEILENSDVMTRNSMIEDILHDVIDSLRDLIFNGSETVPVLDPFEMEEIHVSGDLVDLQDSHITINNIAVRDLGTFEIDQLRVTTVSLLLQRYRIELDGRIPAVNVQVGNYDLSLNLFGGYIFGNGQVKIKIVNPRVYTDIVIGVRLGVNGIFLNVRELTVRVQLDAFEAQITGLFGNEVASDFASTFISSLVPELLEFFEEDITKTLSSAVLDVANEILSDLNLIDLLP